MHYSKQAHSAAEKQLKQGVIALVGEVNRPAPVPHIASMQHCHSQLHEAHGQVTDVRQVQGVVLFSAMPEEQLVTA